MRRKTICILAAFGAVLGGGILLGSTVSASAAELETPDVPVATAVTSMTGEPGWQNEYGVRRYFDESGNAVTGEQEIDGVYYLFDYTGVQKTGWRTVNGVRRYYDPETGEMVSGWRPTATTVTMPTKRPASRPESFRRTASATCWTTLTVSSSWDSAPLRTRRPLIMTRTAKCFLVG